MLVMTSSPYARFVLANIITRPGESFCQTQIGFDHGPSRKEQYIRPVWKFATCLHDSNPTHFPPCSVSTYQKQQHFRSTQPLHPPLRTSRIIKLPRQRPRTQRHGKWATPTLTLTRAVTHMARILRAIIVRTTEAMATAMDTPCATITPHSRTHALMDTGDDLTTNLITNIPTAPDMVTQYIAKSITRVQMEEAVEYTREWWSRLATDIEAARINTES